ncbi:OsmC family protein [Zhouia spongiae]|uniref:OsmC family protein n=1 Tax=Zhouia spongiae TaxID=2202721 RepID=A0ABY3YRT7_9FLAO|nr:OsmC family protein [Zhouia spongiae]UNZ00207.1 OsmC family protein [Zhouia spongiae]
MKAENLKSIQAPLKQKYREEPESAVITLKANGLLGNSISCKVETGKLIVEAGLHPATGGDGTLACSGDLLLEALVACAGVTLNAVATSMGLRIAGGKVTAEGDLDLKGTLGISKDTPVGFREIRLYFEVESHESAESLEKLRELTERYCVVYQTIVSATRVKTYLE